MPAEPMPGRTGSVDLRGRTVMITGASRGLGLALAEAFARAGARLGLCARDESALRDATARIREAGADLVLAGVDVTEPDQVAAWTDLVVERLGPPAVLVNNASVLGERTPLERYPLPTWRRVLEVNLTGALLTIQSVLPSMRREGRGSIINVSSGAAIPPRARWGAYGISKVALDGFTLNLARELKGTGVRVNAVDPGAMRTAMRAEAYPEEDPATLEPPDAVTPIFLWLASDEAGDVTGRRFIAREWRDRAGADDAHSPPGA